MRITAVYKYYWPDTTPYARLLKGILEHWVSEGHEVRVLTAQPGYNDILHEQQPWRERIGGVDVHRLRIVREHKKFALVRVASFLSFLSHSVLQFLFTRKPDLVIVNPHPPILMGLTVRLLRSLLRIPYVYHCQDIHPESALSSGQIRPGILYRLLRWADTGNCRAASLIVTLSEDMAQTLIERGISRSSVVVINNYILGDSGHSVEYPLVLPRLVPGSIGSFVLLHAGNIGKFQGLGHFICVARLLVNEEDIRFVFMGEGSAKKDLATSAGPLLNKSVFFCPYQPLRVARQALVEADLALVSLGRDVYRVAYPSKTMTCLAAGAPVMAVVEADSVLARDILDNDLGFCFQQGDYEGTAAAIREARDRRVHWRLRRPGIAEWASENFGIESTLATWSPIPDRATSMEGKTHGGG